MSWLAEANRDFPWSKVSVTVAGAGVSGFAATDLLLSVGAKVTLIDERDLEEKGKLFEFLGTKIITGAGVTKQLPMGTDLLIISPGWPLSAPILAQAEAANIPIWSEIELAWRLQDPQHKIPWVGVTGTNGKTTTTEMTQAILAAAGLKAAAVGNIGRPVSEALLDDVDYDVLVVELSSFQLHFTHTLSLTSAVVLNVYEDHLRWYENPVLAELKGLEPFQIYAQDKAKIYRNVQRACIYNLAEPITEEMVREADVIEGARAIGFGLKIPSISQLGVVPDGAEELLVDRAFIAQRQDSAMELIKVSQLPSKVPHNIENALAAAALARSLEVPAKAVRDGLKNFQIAAHRVQEVAQHQGITFIDDSKATNPHAADSAMRGFDSFVWIAGGQTKGTNFDELINKHKDKIRGVVLLGIDRMEIHEALTRLAPEIPVVMISDDTPDVMTEVVAQAVSLAAEGDVVLLSPGCASLDMWPSYSARGMDFVQAVDALMKQSS